MYSIMYTVYYVHILCISTIYSLRSDWRKMRLVLHLQRRNYHLSRVLLYGEFDKAFFFHSISNC
jgi:hypothetical protein